MIKDARSRGGWKERWCGAQAEAVPISARTNDESGGLTGATEPARGHGCQHPEPVHFRGLKMETTILVLFKKGKYFPEQHPVILHHPGAGDRGPGTPAAGCTVFGVINKAL